jgi:hypothetical protein
MFGPSASHTAHLEGKTKSSKLKFFMQLFELITPAATYLIEQVVENKKIS